MDRLTMEQHAVYVQMFRRMDTEAKAQEAEAEQARRSR